MSLMITGMVSNPARAHSHVCAGDPGIDLHTTPSLVGCVRLSNGVNISRIPLILFHSVSCIGIILSDQRWNGCLGMGAVLTGAISMIFSRQPPCAALLGGKCHHLPGCQLYNFRVGGLFKVCKPPCQICICYRYHNDPAWGRGVDAFPLACCGLSYPTDGVRNLLCRENPCILCCGRSLRS